MLKLLILSLFSLISSISFCTIKIQINSLIFKDLIIKNKNNFYLEIKKFCINNFINEKECEKVRNYYREKCFKEEKNKIKGEKEEDDNEKMIEIIEINEEIEEIKENERNEKEIKGTMEGIEGINEGIEGKEEEIKKIKEESVEIDYSIKIGPILPVNYEGISRNLQMFSGETPTQAVTRFCGMLKLNSLQCQQVKEGFFKLLNPESVQNENEIENSKNLKEIKQSSILQFESIIEEYLNQIIAFLEKYWNYIFLLLSVIYVIRENPIRI